MDVVDIARWQFGIVTVYHFIMVPLTIGLGVLVAVMQTVWLRTGDDRYLAMTKFWGKLYLINYAMGVVTGIVQEFQFGMNWSEYSRFVGDVFGAPLAMEGIVAFFVESTFLGVWIFGWGRLLKKAHLASIWAATLASVASAYFILAANSWMQHPVGVVMDGGRPRLTSIWEVLGNPTVLVAFPHTVAGSFLVAGALLVGVGFWQLSRHRDRAPDEPHRRVWATSTRWGAWVSIAAFALVAGSGDVQAKLMFEQQPLKMAAAEALCETENPAGFSVLALGDALWSDCGDVRSYTIPGLLSFLANNDYDTPVTGINELVEQRQRLYGSRYPDSPEFGSYAGQPIDYVPPLAITYWSYRLMIGFGALTALSGVAALWLTRGSRVPGSRWPPKLALLGIAMPFLGNILGWILRENGRQPFVVVPNESGVDGVWMFTARAVTRGVSPTEMLISLIALTVVYGVLFAVEFFLIRRYARAGIPGVLPAYGGDKPAPGKSDDVLTFAY